MPYPGSVHIEYIDENWVEVPIEETPEEPVEDEPVEEDFF